MLSEWFIVMASGGLSSTSPVCPKCGGANRIGARYCSNCGNPLQAPTPTLAQSPGTPSGAPSTPRASGYDIPRSYSYDEDYEYQKRTQIDRTKTGLLLLIVGLLVGPVPFIGIIGGILEIIGAILVILGRNAFGKPHSNYAVWSVIIYIVGSVVIFASALMFGFSLAIARLGANGQGLTSDAVSSAINTFLVGLLVGGAITGFATVLFTYALQEKVGRVLLWVGYLAVLIVGLVVFSAVSSVIQTAVQRALVGGVYNPAPIADLQARVRVLQLLGFIPALIYSAAYYLVWSRIGRGEIPSQGVEPSTLSSPSL